MRIEELEVVCQEAARNIVARGDRPLRASVVLPLPQATRVVELPDWPDDDGQRVRLLEQFVEDVMRPANAPCFGFVAEAVAGAPDADVVLVVFGGRGTGSRITAAPLSGDEVGEFLPAEQLDARALPFLRPLQVAADTAAPPDAFGGAVN